MSSADPFIPELGQMVASTTPWQTIDTPRYIQAGLQNLAEHIAEHRGLLQQWELLSVNAGADPYTSALFSMRTFCWCDQEQEGHEEGCPPNFEHHPSGLIITWYKHAGRGVSQNRAVTRAEWNAIEGACLTDITVTAGLGSTTPPGSPT